MTNPWAMGWDAVAALATAGAAVAAVSIWRADHRRARRARAGRVTVRLERRRAKELRGGQWYDTMLTSTVLVLRNGADAPAYDFNVRHATVEADPVLVALVPPGGSEDVPAGEEMLDSPHGDSVELDTWFTMDERRWHIDSKGRLSGGRRDRPGEPDPAVTPT